MFWRLTTVADDYGRFETDPRVILSLCFPLRVHSIKIGTVQKWLKELVVCGLVTTYDGEERKYGFFRTWEKHQRIRAKRSKFPSPTSADICQQVAADCSKTLSNVAENPIENPIENTIEARHKSAAKKKTPLPKDFSLSPLVKQWAQDHGYTRIDERLAHFTDAAIAKGYQYVDWDAAFRNAIRDDWAKLGTPEQDKPGEFDHLPRIDYPCWICGCRIDPPETCRLKWHGMTADQYARGEWEQPKEAHYAGE